MILAKPQQRPTPGITARATPPLSATARPVLQHTRSPQQLSLDLRSR